MNKTIEKRVEEAVRIINSGGKDYISEASAALLSFTPKAGTKVVAVEDTVTQLDGISGTVVGPSKNKGSGFVDVRLENGTVVPMSSNLLVPV